MRPPLFLFLMFSVPFAFVPFVWSGVGTQQTPSVEVSWPTEFDGRSLEQLPLTETEEEFVRQGFPGAIGRFTDGQNVYIIRQIHSISRRVHSTVACLEGAGWQVITIDPWRDSDGRIWTRFSGTRGELTLNFREVIQDAIGNHYSDPASWYWNASRGGSVGPWLMVTIAE